VVGFDEQQARSGYELDLVVDILHSAGARFIAQLRGDMVAYKVVWWGTTKRWACAAQRDARVRSAKNVNGQIWSKWRTGGSM